MKTTSKKSARNANGKHCLSALTYRKIPIIIPGLTFVEKVFLVGLFSEVGGGGE